MATTTWHFTLTPTPFTGHERDLLAEDLVRCGSGPSLLHVLSATVGVSSRWTRPMVLRGFGPDGHLRGAAVVFLCRDAGPSFGLPGPVRSAIRRGPSIWYWERTSLGTDGHASPGLVVEGVDRDEFRDQALRWLRRHQLLGVVVEDRADRPPPSSRGTRGLGVSRVSVRETGHASLLERHRNLSRKMRRFGSRGGTLRRIQGALPEDLREVLLGAYAVSRPLNPPFVELYPQMVRAHSALDSPDAWHVVAVLDGRPVGYHSWWHSGHTLSLLSGAFTRPPGGTVHAYENVLLESMALARDLGCRTAQLGPTVNGVKRALFGSDPTELRFVSALPPMRWGVGLALPRSALAPAEIARVTGG
ncbi:GNAT family N-acetyltransferase [uncultured Serinicoccus sp.]|uniref:GNAT family N-acetyltransferase n=1 Tax=uncultured Serinicoccus sp. TaxID=735514 RepID=UPI00262F94B9|nr:GNAT family N-acetyltransferase [uncultured Serinicoccus sp.]